MSRKPECLTGQRFAKLTTLRPTARRYGTNAVWECKCECGNIIYAPTGDLKRGRCLSCAV